MRPRVSLFTLGGTIASTRPRAATEEGVTPLLTGQDLVAAVPGLDDVADLDVVQFRQCPSADLTLADMVDLASAIEESHRAGAAGSVVTQGTDTLEETAFALSLLVDSPGPVVCTAAMRNPTLPGPDGPANLAAAVSVCAHASPRSLRAVVMNDEIHHSRLVRKAHTSNPAAFRSAPGPIGWMAEGRPMFVGSVPPTHTVQVATGAPVPRVGLVTATVGAEPDQVWALVHAEYDGLVVEAFGGGHVPSSWVAPLASAADRMPVVLASRTGAGQILTRTYSHAGSEQELLAGGLVPAGTLDGPKARVLLTLLLASGLRDDDLRARFAQDSLPEQPPT